MAKARLVKTSDGIEREINAFLERGSTIQAYLNKVVYPQYKKAQAARFQSENSTEGATWAPLSTKPYFAWWEKGPNGKFGTYYAGGYAEHKKYLYADYPGGGNNLMIATGKLSQAARGVGDGTLKVISGNTMTVGVDESIIPYAGYAAEARPFMEFGRDTTDMILDGVANWLMKGEK
jgi:hypothetical protein